MNNPIAQASFDRLRTALLPTATAVKEFILTKTRLNGKAYSFKNHEYQEKIVDILADPDVDVVIEKPSQTGISEVIYRVMLARVSLIRGFSAAIVFPTRAMSNEVFSTRINPIIADCGPLQAIRNNDVDSNSVKMFHNNSIIYALGASPNSKNTVINRPLRTIIADELARCDRGIITSMRSRQRHQDNKSSIYFSTPLFEEADIDAEMAKCGVIWEQILTCCRCGHQFFPDFYENTCIPGFKEPIKTLKQAHIDEFSLEIDKSYLECPACRRETTHNSTDFTWVNTATHPTRPKIGVRLNAYCLPKYVTVPHMVADWLAYEDKVEFHQQVLGLPATKSDTAMDTTQIVFENGEAGNINVWGLDFGKVCHLMIGTVSNDRIFVHTRLKIPLKDVSTTIPQEIARWNCIAGVVDLMPYTNLAVDFVNKMPNTWAAQYIDPAVPIPELFKLKVKEDENFGNVRLIQINKNLFFDTYVDHLMTGRLVFKAGDDRKEIMEHHEAMRRIRDKRFIELRFGWTKPQGNKTVDHFFHTGNYLLAAAKLMVKSSAGSLPLTAMLSSFRLKSEL